MNKGTSGTLQVSDELLINCKGDVCKNLEWDDKKFSFKN